MLLTTKKVQRPRELKWYQAGAMLYGDWGTSKAYTLGIAFALGGHASWFYLGLMSLLVTLVGSCYIMICRLFPDGGGVYSSVKTRSKTLAVIGALLLVADYVVTASLSALDAFHYFNAAHPVVWAMAAILLIGTINWIGPSKVGNLAAWIAVLASASVIVLFVSTLPHLPEVHLELPKKSFEESWSIFVGIVLALSGVEAVANMTGIMVEPVSKTSKKAILPVMTEVALITFLLGVAMNSIPGLEGHTEDMLRALGNHFIGPWYGAFISILFAALLLSAANTGITGLVSILYLLSKDRELPPVLSQLNRHGMPWVALIVATAVPILVLGFEPDLVGLAALYAIGVVSAITLNLGVCATNVKISMRSWQRVFLLAAALILLAIGITIGLQKPKALFFAVTVVTTGLVMRFFAKKVLPAPAPALASESTVLTVSEAREIAPLYKSSSLVALRGLNEALLEEAALRAKSLHENAVYLDVVDGALPIRDLPEEIEPSRYAVELLENAQKALEKYGVTGIPVWQFGGDVGKQIARAAKELEVESVLIGVSRRSSVINLLRGDVLKTLAKNLPRDCHLMITS